MCVSEITIDVSSVSHDDSKLFQLIQRTGHICRTEREGQTEIHNLFLDI